jgi:GNAT superfamily N-acetyltransferase
MTSIGTSDGPRTDEISLELMERCHGNLLEAFRVLARSLPNGRISEEPGVVRIATGVPSPEFNPVFVVSPPSDPSTVIDASSSFMASAGVSAWRVVAFSGAEAVVGAAALSAGFRPGPVRPGMVLDPIPTRPPSLPSELRVRRTRSRDVWTTLVKVMMRGFGGEAPDDIEGFFPYRMATVFRGYVGFVGKTPVATSVGLSYRGIGGVYSVATLPEFRGKGYGAALSWQAAVGTRREGCRASYLQASEMGYPVYARMGYQKVTSYPEWLAGPP